MASRLTRHSFFVKCGKMADAKKDISGEKKIYLKPRVVLSETTRGFDRNLACFELKPNVVLFESTRGFSKD